MPEKRANQTLHEADGPHGGTPPDAETLARAIMDNLHYRCARVPAVATRNDWYLALAYTVRDRIVTRWGQTLSTLLRKDARVVSYLSAEFLLGPHLLNNLINLGICDEMREAARRLRLDFDALVQQEAEPGLGNGGLGRLAACFMDSLATLEILAIGYGVRYEFGIFEQHVVDGWQVEKTDKWLHLGNPWEIERPEIAFEVSFGGRTEAYFDREGNYRVCWVPRHVVKGVACDTPIIGYRVASVNLLRLWKAEAVESFDFQAFNRGDYFGAVDEKIVSETVSKVLYPNDEPEIGKRLRLAQQYFFVSCTLQDLIRFQLLTGNSLDTFHEANAVQLNDTHPAIGVAELMRLLVDEHLMGWERAWEITTRCFSYTNHTLLPEALEKWPVPLLGQMLPRHLEIIYEINRRFLDEVRLAYPGDTARLSRMSLIEEGEPKHVRMAHLATVGSHAVNGVAALHSDLVKHALLRDFHDLWPERFHNVTNGVTPRRWMALSNPRLTRLISERVGDGWIGCLEGHISELEACESDDEFRQRWREVKEMNKRDLGTIIAERSGVAVDPKSLFDIMVKRIHEYKRQHLCMLHVVTLYNRIRKDPGLAFTPRTVIFGGKAAPGYFMAKLIIKLIHSVAERVNGDPLLDGRLRLVFLPDFNVKNAHHIYPAADLSEQISLAGKEASGTGNMKFALNGALTIGTLDGANIEIREQVGGDNFFLFGLDAAEVADLKSRGHDPRRYRDADPELAEALDMIGGGFFSDGDRGLFKPLVDNLLSSDDYLLLADYRAYVDCQQAVGRAFSDIEGWTRMSIRNVARMGKFSSDRAIKEYADRIWRVGSVAFPQQERP